LTGFAYLAIAEARQNVNYNRHVVRKIFSDSTNRLIAAKFFLQEVSDQADKHEILK